jgi:hypothetical protein
MLCHLGKIFVKSLLKSTKKWRFIKNKTILNGTDNSQGYFNVLSTKISQTNKCKNHLMRDKFFAFIGVLVYNYFETLFEPLEILPILGPSSLEFFIFLILPYFYWIRYFKPNSCKVINLTVILFKLKFRQKVYLWMVH